MVAVFFISANRVCSVIHMTIAYQEIVHTWTNKQCTGLYGGGQISLHLFCVFIKKEIGALYELCAPSTTPHS